MISALHLLWIIPLSACFGFAVAALLAVGKMVDKSIESEETLWNG